MPEISVIMPAHIVNEAQWQWFGEAVNSVYNQTFRDIEVIIVFDGSPITASERDLPPEITVIKLPERRGPGNARNVGVQAAVAPWIVCLDADDRLKPDGLATLYSYRHEAYYCYGDFEYIGDRQGLVRLSDFNPDELRAMVGPCGVTALFSRGLWEYLGGWRTDLIGLEDIEFWIRAAEANILGRHIKEVIFEYRQHADSRTRGLNKDLLQAVHAEIRQNHKTFMDSGGRSTMQKPDLVRLKYTGSAHAGFLTPNSPLTTKQYRCDGFGAFVDVDARDVAWLTSFHSGQMAGFVLLPPVTPPLPAFSLVQDHPLQQQATLAASLPEIQNLPEKEAIVAIKKIADVPDLMVMLALENATDARPGVVAAIDHQVKVLSGEAAPEPKQEAQDLQALNVKNATAAVEEIDDPRALLKLRDKELDGPARKTVLAAIDKRYEALSAELSGQDG